MIQETIVVSEGDQPNGGDSLVFVLSCTYNVPKKNKDVLVLTYFILRSWFQFCRFGFRIYFSNFLVLSPSGSSAKMESVSMVSQIIAQPEFIKYLVF